MTTDADAYAAFSDGVRVTVSRVSTGTG